jgi:hypothetical protein
MIAVSNALVSAIVDGAQTWYGQTPGVFAMAITSNERVRRAMSSRSWKFMHRTGMHLAWLAFTATYAGATGVRAAGRKRLA